MGGYFREALDEEIKEGLIEVESQFSRIVIRIRENGSFPSGDARLNPSFKPILKNRLVPPGIRYSY